MTNIFNGVPHDHQASGVFPNDPTITYFFYYDGNINKVYKHDSTSNTTTIHDIGSGSNQLFPNLPTTQAMDRAAYNNNNINMHIKWQDPSGSYWQRSYSSATIGVGGALNVTGNDVLQAGITPNANYACFINPANTLEVALPNNGWATDHLYTNGNWGGTTTPYNGLPQTQHRSINMIPSSNTKVLVFYDTGMVYTIDLTTQAVVSSAPYGAFIPPLNIYNGVPHDHQASGVYPNDPTITYFFYYDGTINKVYKHDSTSNTTTIHDIGSGANQLFPNLPTTQAMDRAVWSSNGNIYVKWENSPGIYYQRAYTSSTTNSGGATTTPSDEIHNAATANTSFSIGISTTSLSVFLPNNGWALDHQYNQGSWGGTTAYYTGLPQTQHRSMNMIPSNNNQVLVFYDTGIVYTIDLSTQAVVSSAPYGAVIPPTPLPDIEVVYSPSQFNLFSNNVALVTETQYGWNFTKTILNSDKMELYIYHSSVSGAIPFNYNQLRDIKVNMKNNLVLPTGEIFLTIWTGPAVAPNWYNYKDIYNMTPALGTTIDIDLVETILTLSDTRTDPILAIALHSNSSQQQVNCDVERVSFEVLLPANNNTQRVSVKLQNSFIVVDDKYWDLENNAVAKMGTTILPGFQISDFSPNIIAGNYPQSGTAKEVPSGAAWYLKGTYTEWIQNVANTWVVSGNTIEFTSNAVNPGVDTNGAAYIGCLGGVALTGTWSPTPFTWEITASNQLKILNTDGSTITFSPLVDLPQPNNFTAVQAESGCFSSSNVGTLDTTALISNSVASFKSPIFPTEIDLTFLSESQVIIRRSWEIVDTTYNITSSNILSGQYVSPTYPNNGNLSLPPDSYNMPTAWVVLANNDSQFFIEFSGGLNNTITADGTYNMAVNPVGPSPITYAWTANYYTSADVLISPVVGFGATGSVSNFTIALASVPSSAEYILYVCTSSENVQAFASLVIIQAAAAIPFVLDFQNQSAQIVVDATYTVTPNPVDAGATYAYTATYNNEFDASLGNVLGAVASGPQSSFNFVYANIPTGSKYINYTCSATGGNQGGETARLSISIIPQIPPAPPPPPPVNNDLELIRSTTGSIIFNQYNSEDSLKLLTADRIAGLTMTLTDSYGDNLYSPAPVYYELQVESSNSG